MFNCVTISFRAFYVKLKKYVFMKKMILRCPMVFGLMLLGMVAFAQSKTINTVSTGNGNYIESYTEDISAIGKILNTTDQSVIDATKMRIKEAYQSLSGTMISDEQLNNMLIANTNNLTTWNALYEEIQDSASEEDKYVIQSLITNIKKKANF
jgi:hypothetical protein